MLSLRLVRPYATEEELIAAEAWAIDKKGIVLVGQPRLASGTVVRFELLLEGGERVLVAEGKAVGYTKADGDRPGGAKVRFKRFNASGKAFIERALAAKAAQQAEPGCTPAPKPGSAMTAEATNAAEPQAPPAMADPEQSGIRHRASGPVAPPDNRDELLDKLRERARLVKARDAEETNQSA